MPHITLCDNCGTLYEAGSEEQANEVTMTLHGRRLFCPACVTSGVVEAVLRHLKFDSPGQEDHVRRRLAYDDDGE